MGFPSILSFAHKLIEERVHAGDAVVDATVGNGVDTLFLAELAASRGRVYGFDIQQQALDNAAARLRKAFPAAAESVQFFLRSHADMAEAVPLADHGHIQAVMFNLGYLPGADHGTITRPTTTLPALEAALTLLAKSGIITAVLYPGHEGGQEEARCVLEWAASLPHQQYQVLQHRFVNQRQHSPYLIAIEKR